MAVTLGLKSLIEANLVMVQGVTFEATFIYNVEEGGQDVPVDMSGWTALCQIRDSDDSLVLDMSNDITFGSNGVLVLKVEDEETVTVPVRKGYRWDMLLEDTDGDVMRLAAGKVQMFEKVSHG